MNLDGVSLNNVLLAVRSAKVYSDAETQVNHIDFMDPNLTFSRDDKRATKPQLN